MTLIIDLVISIGSKNRMAITGDVGIRGSEIVNVAVASAHDVVAGCR